MDRKDMQKMIINYYKNVFTVPWGETWYSSAIRSLIASAVENEIEYNREKEEKILIIKRLRDESWEPYELIVETQIGLVLVMCQTYITRVISRVNCFYKEYELCFDKKLLRIDSSKRALMANYGPRIKDIEYRSIEIIDALANYFKHHDEWGKLDLLVGNEKRTAEIVTSVGANLSLEVIPKPSEEQ